MPDRPVAPLPGSCSTPRDRGVEQVAGRPQPPLGASRKTSPCGFPIKRDRWHADRNGGGKPCGDMAVRLFEYPPTGDRLWLCRRHYPVSEHAGWVQIEGPES